MRTKKLIVSFILYFAFSFSYLYMSDSVIQNLLMICLINNCLFKNANKSC